MCAEFPAGGFLRIKNLRHSCDMIPVSGRTKKEDVVLNANATELRCQDMRMQFLAPGGQGFSLRSVLLGGPQTIARCWIRRSIIGAFRPDDRRRLIWFGLMLVALNAASVLIALDHARMVHFVEMLISLCT